MARPLRVEYEGAIYHVTVRGNDRRNIFLDDRDRQRFLRQRKGSLLRPITAKMLCRHSGLTQREAGAILDLSTGAAVSMQLKALAATAAAKGKLRRQLTSVDKAICAEIERESETPKFDN